MEQDARKSPQVCHVTPQTAWVWSVRVNTHFALEKSQIFTVASPDEVARRAPLKIELRMELEWGGSYNKP